MTLQSINADKTTLRILADAISILERQGGTASDAEIWSFASGPIESTALLSPLGEQKPVLYGALKVIHQMETARKILESLVGSMDQMLETTKEKILPTFRHHGIKSLPDEILEKIFLMMQSAEFKFTTRFPELVVSHVCRHFRNVAINCPLLWSRLTSKMSESHAVCHFQRSENVDFTVIIEEGKWTERLERFIRLATSYASRWKTFNLYASPEESDTVFGQNLGKFLGHLYLPKLEYFEAHAYCDDCPRETFHFYETWRMPELRSMSFGDAPLPSHTEIFNFSAITSFSVDWLFEGHDPHRLMDCIRALPNLNDLKLIIESPAPGFVNNDTEKVVLPRLRRFSFRVKDPEAFWSMMHCLDIPALENLSLDLSTFDDIIPPWKWLHGWHFTSTSVRMFSFRYRGSRKDAIILESIYIMFPALEQLFIDAWGNPIDFDCHHTETVSPPLRSIVVRGKPDRSSSFCEFVTRLQRHGRWDGFKRLQFSDSSMKSNAASHFKDRLIWLRTEDVSCHCSRYRRMHRQD